MGEDRADAHSVGSGGDRLTIAEAATLLGVHKNTVRNRIKDGTYKAEKVVTERGQTYLIERKSLLNNLTTNTLSSDSQQLVNPAPMEFVRELLRPLVRELGDFREELGAERVRRQMAEERAAALEAELQELKNARESPVSEASTDPDDIHPTCPRTLRRPQRARRRADRRSAGPGGGGCSVAEGGRPQHEVPYLHVRPPRSIVGVGGEGDWPVARIISNRAALLELRGQIDRALAAEGCYRETDEAEYDLWVMRATTRKQMGEPREPERPDRSMFA